MREADVPGRKLNIAERAGIGEDYILTNANVVKSSAPGGAPGGQTWREANRDHRDPGDG
jgi:hypothetical protein